MVISMKIFYMVVSLFMSTLYSLFTLLEKGSDTVKMLKSKIIYSFNNDQTVISKKIFYMVVSLFMNKLFSLFTLREKGFDSVKCWKAKLYIPLTMIRRLCWSRTRNKCKPLKSLVALFYFIIVAYGKRSNYQPLPPKFGSLVFQVSKEIKY